METETCPLCKKNVGPNPTDCPHIGWENGEFVAGRKAGRPKKDGGRTEKLYLKISPETKRAWEAHAEKVGRSMGDLATEIARGWEVDP